MNSEHRLFLATTLITLISSFPATHAFGQAVPDPQEIIKEARDYTDTRTAVVYGQAQDFADTAQSNAQKYADEQVSNVGKQAQGYADTAQSNAQKYADEQVSNVGKQAQGYADTAQSNAQKYTDSRLASITSGGQDHSYTDMRINKAYEYFNQQMRNMKRNMNGGIAGAMAMAQMPQASIGHKSVAMSIGEYGGQESFAAGGSWSLKNGLMFRTAGSVSTRGHGGFGAGMGYQW